MGTLLSASDKTVLGEAFRTHNRFCVLMPPTIGEHVRPRRTLFARLLALFYSWFGSIEFVATRVEATSTSRRLDLDARDIMTDDVVTVCPDDGVERAALLMRETGCSSLPVVDRFGKLVGMISDHDITVRLVARSANITCSQVSDCMTYEAFACEAGSSIESCVKAMDWHEVDKIAIVDRHHQVIGIISRSDVAWPAQELIVDETTDWPAEFLCFACSSKTRVRRESHRHEWREKEHEKSAVS